MNLLWSESAIISPATVFKKLFLLACMLLVKKIFSIFV